MRARRCGRGGGSVGSKKGALGHVHKHKGRGGALVNGQNAWGHKRFGGLVKGSGEPLTRPTMDELRTFAAFAEELADAARAAALHWAEAGWETENKLGEAGFDPVTQADRAAEAAMRELIEARCPDHGIAGEEFGEKAGAGRYVWSLDPIDGTRAFICGLPSWTVLIALLDEGRPVVGVIDAPKVDERYVGLGSEAVLAGAGRRAAMRTSGCRSLRDARLSTTDEHIVRDPEAFSRVRREARLTRYGLDGYAYGRLAAGGLDLVIETGLKPHDYNALIPVVRAAGGVIGNWRGEDDFSAGDVVAAATPELFEEAVALLRA
jgi:histidinol phosphatase-like enzyme (inositol monophosphatase family)